MADIGGLYDFAEELSAVFYMILQYQSFRQNASERKNRKSDPISKEERR